MARRRRLGEVLIDDGVITEFDLARALEEQAASPVRRRLGATLVELGVASEDEIATGLANQLRLQRVNLHRSTPDMNATSRVPADVAHRHHVVPLRFDEDGTLFVAMADPTNVLAIDELRMTTRATRVTPMVATASDVALAIGRIYSGSATLADADNYAGMGEEEEDDVRSDEIESKPIVRLANTLIVDAVRMRASDIHIEPTRGDVRVRFRVDGILTEVMKVPRPARASLTSRLKLMAGMDISERRRPQDGRTAVTVHGEAVDLRVSAMPSMHGEKLVLRLLRRGGERLELDDLNLAPDVRTIMLEALETPQGIVLITGPTGSGKTTTVYAGLAQIATITRNVITLEDPIEYELELINQTQVNPRIGFTFAVGMRTVLRQDPDVVMVGEIRDPETAELAFEAAMTGHLVLSTVHTNNAPATVLRMSELGVERHLIASSLSLVIAQRLVRLICDECGEPDNSMPDARILRRLRIDPEILSGVTTRRRGRGCAQCVDTGFKGRVSVVEALAVTPRIRDLITDGARESTILNIAREEGMRSMRQDGLIKVMLGMTTFEEVLRATPDDPRLDSTALIAAMADGDDGLAPFVIERRRTARPVEASRRTDRSGSAVGPPVAFDDVREKHEPNHEDDQRRGDQDEEDPAELAERADALMSQAEAMLADPNSSSAAAEQLMDEADALMARVRALEGDEDSPAESDVDDPARAHAG